MLELKPLDRPHDSLFWSAPGANSEFAAEDPLALDYLAQQVGLFLLPTLTTRSARAQSYAVVLYGLELVTRALSVYDHPDDDEARRLLFERWERFWALSVLEARDGVIRPGDPDAMRGLRGAVKAWASGDRPLSLDYPLISRQLELGSLGAYLSPLRLAGLVIPGTLRPSPAAGEILDAFWDEPGETSRAKRYEAYAMEALDLRRNKIDRKIGGLTLAKVGDMSRLSSLVVRGRSEQQQRLYRAIIENVADRTGTTLPIATIIETATRDGVFESRQLIDGALEQRWGTIDSSLRALLVTARAFGDAMAQVLRFFDRAYVALSEAGWQGARAKVAAQALGPEHQAELRAACDAFLASPELVRLQRLPMHGGPFVRLASELRVAGPDEALARVLEYHLAIQRERRRGDAWIRDRAGHLTLMLTTYDARPDAARFPGYKLGIVRQLLVDVGRLSAEDFPDESEVAS